MIKRIKHEFSFTDKKHKSFITLVKDSLEEELDVAGPVEPSADKSDVTKYKYN